MRDRVRAASLPKARICATAIAFFLPSFGAAAQTVDAFDNASLQAAILAVNAGTATTINITADITQAPGAANQLTAIMSAVTINGNGHTITGTGAVTGGYGIFFVSAPVGAAVNISDLNLTNGYAKGGNGGAGAGGGLGAGGAIFARSGEITLTNVGFAGNIARGGNGGGNGSFGGGGGLNGGNGGSGGPGGGGGGVGVGATGGGGAGILPGGNGGFGGGANSGGGGNGGGFVGGGGGGTNGNNPWNGNEAGGNGGFGGGGGGDGGGGNLGGVGGFGGGGGMGSDASGAGGFGGGGGGSGNGVNGNRAGGYGANPGRSNTQQGGGGAGLGGSVFVCTAAVDASCGATLTINNTSGTNKLLDGTAQGGSDWAGGAAGAGGSLFLGSGTGLTLNIGSGSTTTISGGIWAGSYPYVDGGDLGLNVSGGGTLALVEPTSTPFKANYTGNVNVSGAGTIVSTNSDVMLGTGNSVVLGNGSGLRFTAAGTYGHAIGVTGATSIGSTSGVTSTQSGQISGAGSVNVAGGGRLILSNATNSYTLGTIVSGNSTVSVSADGQLGDVGGGVTLGDATSRGTLNATETFVTARTLTLETGGGTLDVATGKVLTWNGQVTGAGGLTKAGAGNLILSVANDYLGGTFVNAGTLTLSGAGTLGNAAGATTVASGTLNLGATTQTQATLNQSGGIVQNGTMNVGTYQMTGGTLAAGTTVSATTAFDMQAGTVNGVLAGAGVLNKSGPGTVTLSSANSYTGGTSVSAGTLALSGAGTLGNITNTTTVSGGTLDLGTTTQTQAALNQSGGTVQNGTMNVGTYQMIGGTLAAGATVSATTAFDMQAGTVNGVLTGAGALNKTGTGTVTLSSANSYTGGTSVSAGTLALSGTGTLGNAGNTTTVSGGTLDLGTTTQTQATLNQSGGTVQNGTLNVGTYQLTGGTLAGGATVSAATAFDMQAGTVNGVLTGMGALTKSGAGTVTLTGANTYGGGTTISAGSLRIGGGGTTGSILGNVTNNAALVFDRSNTVTFAGVISGSGTVEQAGSGITVLTGNNSYSGGTIVSGGTLSLGHNNAAGTGAITTTGSVIDYVNGVSIGNAIVVNSNTTQLQVLTGTAVQAGVISESGGARPLEKIGAGTLVLSANNTYTGVTTISEGALHIGNGGGSGSIIGDVVNNAVLAFNRTGSVTYGGAISGSGAFEQNGIGTTILTGSNSYAGTTTINAGTLQIGNNGTTGTLGAGNVINNGTLAFDRTNTVVYSGNIVGGGALQQNGSGTTVLTGSNSYTGTTTINAGILQIGNNGTTGSLGTGNVINNGTLAFNRTDTVIYGGDVSGSGAFVQDGSGPLILTGSNTFAGGTTINAGVLQIGNGGTTGSITGDVTNNAALAFSRSNGISFAGAITGSGYVDVVSGALTLTNASNLYAGGTLVRGNGTLSVSSDAMLGATSGGLTLGDAVSGGAFVATNTFASARGVTLGNGGGAFATALGQTLTLSGVIGGAGALTNFGAGTTVLTGANTYGGGTILTAGSLRIGGGGMTGSITGNVLNDAALVFDRSNVVTFAGVISGSGTVEQAGSGITLLTGNNSYSGGTIVSGGTLSLGHNNAAGTGAITTTGSVIDYVNGVSIGNTIIINSNTTQLQVLAGAAAEQAGVISEAGGARPLEKIGAGTLVLSAANIYTGVTTITAGTLQIGNGGSSGSIIGDVVNNAVLAFNRTGSVTYGGAISGSGAFEQNGPGTTILTGANTYTGVATINAGILQIGNGTTGSLGTGNVVNHAALVFARSNSVTYGGDISGTGTLSQTGAGTTTLTGASTFSGGTTISAGTLQIGNGGATGSLAGNIVNNAVLAFDRTGSLTLGGNITGTGAVNQSGTGKTIFTGANNYSGITTIAAGTLQIGNGGTTGSLGTGNVVNNATLAFDRSNAYQYSGVISGTGAVRQTGSGTTTLTGVNTYTGATTVTAGVLRIAAGGSIVSAVTVGGGLFVNNGSMSGATTVNAGAAIGGIGAYGDTTINGGTLAPGNSIGTLTINGNLGLTAASTYMLEVDPNGADRTNVTGTATLGGATVSARYANGSYVAQRYTILNAAGGVNGTFNTLVNTNLPANFSAALSYDAGNAYLNLRLNFALPTIPGGLSGNQQSVGNALVGFFNSTGGIPLAYGALTSAQLNQAAGEAATGTQQATFNVMDRFLNAMLDPFATGRDGYSPQSGVAAYADASTGRSASERDAYAAMARKAPARFADPFASRWNVWATGYGGTQTTQGSMAAGTADTTARIYGTAAGADYRLSPETLIGFSLGGAGTNYGLASGLGKGSSEVFQAGVYARHNMGAAYLAGALAYGWQDVTTDRTVLGIDRLRARFDANAFSGRVEGGYRFATPWMGVTPYAAGQFTSFFLPNYAEQVVAGANTFALAYAAKDVTASRSELGLRTDTSFALNDALLTLRGRAAWAHNFDTSRSISATFQALPAAGFTVNGAAPARDAALVSAGAEMTWRNGFSLAGTFEGEFSRNVESYAGKGTVRYQW